MKSAASAASLGREALDLANRPTGPAPPPTSKSSMPSAGRATPTPLQLSPEDNVRQARLDLLAAAGQFSVVPNGGGLGWGAIVGWLTHGALVSSPRGFSYCTSTAACVRAERAPD